MRRRALAGPPFAFGAPDDYADVMHIAPSRIPIILAGFGLTASCSSADDIDESGVIFDGIAETAEISLAGTEPFWAISIKPEGDGFMARYSAPENLEGTNFDVDRFAGNNGLGFSGSMDDQPVQITITPGECSDFMSERTYPYTATVAIGERTLLGCGYTSDEPFEGDEAP